MEKKHNQVQLSLADSIVVRRLLPTTWLWCTELGLGRGASLSRRHRKMDASHSKSTTLQPLCCQAHCAETSFRPLNTVFGPYYILVGNALRFGFWFCGRLYYCFEAFVR